MIDAYEALKTLAASGKFVLAELNTKIQVSWIGGYITDDQRTELLALADANQPADYTGLSSAEQSLLARVIDTEAALIEIAALAASSTEGV